ncbi:MAG TPA: LysM peptidoglycan-binding domain-containing protein [Nitrospiraceae bacterium]|nr:LysM peptidoglycan-binding domain-containing protein [Nitrospiraceae bacterium]
MTKTSAQSTPAYRLAVRVGTLCAVGFAAVLFVGCGELEPMREPEVVELELTTDTLKASVREAQRTVTELRADLEARRRELAEAQVARAQLEGRVREAERRVIEARQVIELQREELAAARTERERVFRSSLQLQSQMKQLRRQRVNTGKLGSAQGAQEATPLPSSGATRKSQKAIQVPVQQTQPSEFLETPQMVAAPASARQVPADREPSSGVEQPRTPMRHVSVKPGDTLWRIAQNNRVSVEYLRTFNQLTDNRIVIGQALWLPDDRPMSEVDADKGSATP